MKNLSTFDSNSINSKKKRVAIVYDRVNKWGGAERVLHVLHSIFPDAPLYTSVYNKEGAPWAKSFKVIPSFLQQIPFATRKHEYYPFLMPLAFESFSFEEYDLVISVTSEAAKGIITSPATKHVCICLTPTRYLWSGYLEYFANPLFRLVAAPVIWYLRTWDRIAASRPDGFIAISEEVKKRISTYYHRESVVMYPPVSTFPKSNFVPVQKNYFLVVSRLSRFTTYKRVDIAIQAATALSLPLVVVGEGNKKQFQKHAGPTVHFVGKVSDEELYGYYAHCRALIFSGLEDFGLVMVEAQQIGKPVIAYNEGGAKEIVVEGKTGTFFHNQTVESLVEALKTFNEKGYNREYCKQSAARFSQERFEDALRTYIDTL